MPDTPDRVPRVALVAGLTFLFAFAVADLTGIRPLGGLVLVAGGVWCAWQVLPVAGRARTGALMALALGAFVASHPLGNAIGSWTAVLVMAAGVAVATAWIVHTSATQGEKQTA